MVDTDVVVNAIAMFNQINPDELWLAFGTGSNFCYISIHEVVSGMNRQNCVLFYQFFTHLQDTIPTHLLVEEEKRQLG